MKRLVRATLGALMVGTAAIALSAPAAAQVNAGISFGFADDEYQTFSDPCDYYDYYDEAPPWGLPPDYCDYPVYFDPVFYDGIWYRGPIYYRWDRGQRLFWLHGGWREDSWRGGRMPQIRWNDRGGWRGNHGGGQWSGNRNWSGGNGGGHSWSGNNGGGRNWSGGNGGGGNGGGHNWSGGGGGHGGNGGGHNWSGGGGHSSGGGHGGSGHNWHH